MAPEEPDDLIRDAGRTDEAATGIEWPQWRCHKIVHALKIKEVLDPSVPGEESDGSRLLVFDEGDRCGPFAVLSSYVRKHNPQAGGYYVLYDDGYASWSPAKAFEQGYTRIAP